MKCPKCHTWTKTIDSRGEGVLGAYGYVRRRRACPNKSCAFRFTTYERIESADSTVKLERRLRAIDKLTKLALEEIAP